MPRKVKILTDSLACEFEEERMACRQQMPEDAWCRLDPFFPDFQQHPIGPSSVLFISCFHIFGLTLLFVMIMGARLPVFAGNPVFSSEKTYLAGFLTVVCRWEITGDCM